MSDAQALRRVPPETEDGTKTRSTKGWWVSPPDEIKELIKERCKESLRDPQQEIVWLLRDWYRKVHEPSIAKSDKAPTDTGI